MSLEIEAKIKVDSHQKIRAKLVELGADRIGQVFEKNHIFDNAQRTLLAGGRGLRIRSCRSLEGEASSASITFKGPQLDKDLKVREEITTGIDNPQNACTLLKALGYLEFLYFEKRRESWRLDNCKIELDEVPYLGHYVEIEGPNQQQVHRLTESLGLHTLPNITKSYIALLIEYCQQQGIDSSQITFEQTSQ
ncbi:MAG: class IV adenylate cyclase [Planctomycetota bacterium]|nr:MAG: class IV adenylate cyclase [Planctomycetota bacterium]